MHKQLQLIIIALLCFASQYKLIAQGGVGINATGLAPNNAAILDISSTNKGLLIPRMSTSDINGIQSPPLYLMVVDTSTNCLEMYGYGNWQTISCLCSGPPSTPAAINGDTLPCSGETSVIYSVMTVIGVNSYTWTVPANATITAGQGTNSITVNMGSIPGNVSVVANNNCGSSNASILPVGINNAPSTPGTITGNALAIGSSSNNLYSISPVNNASNYTWTLPAGSFVTAGQGTDSILVTFGTISGNISVTAGNSCGTSSSSSLAISICNYGPGSQTFNYTGGSQIFTVPCGVSFITIAAWGAAGGVGNQGGNIGGLGGYATGTLAVTGGQLLQINVGQMPPTSSNVGGWNGGGNGGTGGSGYGGGGGGASDVRLMTDTSLNGRLIVAGGGGGDAGSGYGGGIQGCAYGNNLNQNPSNGSGGGGTQSAGGAAGQGVISNWPNCASNGNAGSFGVGADGVYNYYPAQCGVYISGGGGGGWYGGGSGGTSGNFGGGPSGGGSGYTGGVASGSMQTGIQNGNGQITISW